MKAKKSVGMDIVSPQKTCNDVKCPFHGTLKLRGRTFVGDVTSDLMSKTVTIEFERRVFIPKYERYAKKLTKIKAHNPDCIKAVKGDKVKVVESRPLSKTKNFVVVEILPTLAEEKKETAAPKKAAVKDKKEKS